jgi:hypothetical protein
MSEEETQCGVWNAEWGRSTDQKEPLEGSWDGWDGSWDSLGRTLGRIKCAKSTMFIGLGTG